MTLTVPQRIESALLAASIVVGSLLFWIGIPLAAFWLAAQLTSDSVRGVLIALILIPVSMAAAAFGLYRLNARYEQLRGVDSGPRRPPSWRGSLGEGRGDRPPLRLLDVAMTAAAVIALVLFLVWYFASPDLRLTPLS
jgi:uncharacterized membrane protein (DUF485 family)